MNQLSYTFEDAWTDARDCQFIQPGERVDTQLDRIEAKLDKLLALLEKPKREPRKAKEQYDPEFDVYWNEYPKRAGSNPKKAAYKAFQARLKEGVYVTPIFDGLMRYKRFCEATGKVGTEYVCSGGR